MSFDWAIFEDGDLFGLTYRFAKRGAGIGMHTHTEGERHNIIVRRGAIQVYGHDKAWAHTLAPGDVMALGLEHHPHELVALKDDTEILSLHIHGKPHGYDEADEPRSGTIHHKPVTITLDSDTN